MHTANYGKTSITGLQFGSSQCVDLGNGRVFYKECPSCSNESGKYSYGFTVTLKGKTVETGVAYSLSELRELAKQAKIKKYQVSNPLEVIEEMIEEVKADVLASTDNKQVMIEDLEEVDQVVEARKADIETLEKMIHTASELLEEINKSIIDLESYKVSFMYRVYNGEELWFQVFQSNIIEEFGLSVYGKLFDEYGEEIEHEKAIPLIKAIRLYMKRVGISF